MKNLLLISSVLLLASCSDSGNNGCDCTEQRWEKTTEYQGTTNNPIATTDWNAIGNPAPISSTDCTQNGTIGNQGVVSTEVLPNGNTKKHEFEYRITCQ